MDADTIRTLQHERDQAYRERTQVQRKVETQRRDLTRLQAAYEELTKHHAQKNLECTELKVLLAEHDPDALRAWIDAKKATT